MAYDDGGRRYPDGYGPPDDNTGSAATTGYASPDYPEAGYNEDPYPGSEAPTADNRFGTESTSSLDDRLGQVYDEVQDENLNDRFLVHAILEVVLVLGAAGALFALYRADSALFTGDGLKVLAAVISPILLFATAAALSLRVRSVNLALPSLAYAGAVLFERFYDDRGFAMATAISLGAVLGTGLLLSLLILLLKIPGWAASLGVGFGLFAYITTMDGPGGTVEVGFEYDVTPRAMVIFGAAVALSVLGGVIGALPGTRRVLGTCRKGDDSAQRSRGAVTMTLFGVLGSSGLAGAAGIVLTLIAASGASIGGGLAFTSMLYFAGAGLAAALLGGTSAHGRRGGVLGTALATLALGGVVLLGDLYRWDVSSTLYVGAGLGLGFVATWLVERFGRPEQPEREERYSSPASREDDVSSSGFPRY